MNEGREKKRSFYSLHTCNKADLSVHEPFIQKACSDARPDKISDRVPRSERFDKDDLLREKIMFNSHVRRQE